jgi:cytochrome c biogenesis protein
VQYKLRDKTGQAREYFNYMQPLPIDGADVFLAGMREQPDQPFRYLRIPADDNDSVAEWMRLRAALANPALREEAARRYAQQAISSGRETSPVLREQLQQSALRGLSIFAGDGKVSGYRRDPLPGATAGGRAGKGRRYLHEDPQRQHVGALAGGARQGRPGSGGQRREAWPLPAAGHQCAGRCGLLSGAGVPATDDFQEIKASVLQVTRSPGKKVVYLGCLFLVLGVFAMLYIRERRLWIWIKPGADGQGSQALMAMSTQRRTLDFDKEFEQMKGRLTGQRAVQPGP